MKKKFTTTLNVDLIKKIKLEALKEERSVGDILDELINNYLKDKKAV